MKLRSKIIRSSLSVVGLALIFGFFGALETKAQGVLKTILDRMDAHYKGLSSIRSDLTLVKYNAQIEKRDTSLGSVNVLPKTTKRVLYARIDWTKPKPESIVVIGDAYKMYQPGINQVISGKANGAKNSKVSGNALAFLSMSKSQLQANYKVSYIGEEKISGGTNTWHILMTPKVATSYKSADLWVDGDGMPRQAMITENNDDTSTFLFTNIQKNITIDASYFRLVYPKGTKEVKG